MPHELQSETYSKISEEINDHVKELEEKISNYGSFNLVANSIFHNNIQDINHYKDYIHNTQPSGSEYLALIVLKFPFSMDIKEMTNARGAVRDFYEINTLVNTIIEKYTYLHYRKYHTHESDGKLLDAPHIAQQVSSNELLVRNPTFESFHWDLLEGLYERYDDHFKKIFGFDTNDAIRICITIADYIDEGFQKAVKGVRESSKQMYAEIIEYKHRNKKPKNFWPQEHLDQFKTMRDEDIRQNFFQSMLSYHMGMLGHTISFTAKDIADMEDIPIDTVQSFLNKLCINFNEIKPDFSKPEIIHPLKDRPILHHDGRYLCASTSLLDYSLDRLFADTLFKDGKRIEKYKEHRHNYLLNEGVKLIAEILRSTAVYKNLKYSGGEMDGLIFCDSNIFFIEAKSHRITDRAKRGYIDRIEDHIEEIIESSYKQALRSYNYLFGKENVVFTDQSGKEIVLNGTSYHNAYFISLSLEDISAISCNLKVNNSIYSFQKDLFPWIVSLYDLRAVCDHMEGPSYFIQYLHRRKEFFKLDKFYLRDELDILGYYLKRNLRFDSLIREQYEQVAYIQLDSYLEEFNRYYLYKEGKSKKEYPKMVHSTILPIKNLVNALEECSLPYGKDAGTHILEFSTDLKQRLLAFLKKVKKQQLKDGEDHNFRLIGTDVNEYTWMLSYWVGPEDPEYVQFFENWVIQKSKEEPVTRYTAILDTGKKTYKIARIIDLWNKQSEAI